MKVIDADGVVLGRLASKIAKMLIHGEKVVIVNAEKAIITGNKKNIFARYKQRVDRADRANPKHGPKFPRTPERLVKRTVRGMINYKTDKGKKALEGLKAYVGRPEEVEVTEKFPKTRSAKYVTVKEVCEFLGWKNPME